MSSKLCSQNGLIEKQVTSELLSYSKDALILGVPQYNPQHPLVHLSVAWGLCALCDIVEGRQIVANTALTCSVERINCAGCREHLNNVPIALFCLAGVRLLSSIVKKGV